MKRKKLIMVGFLLSIILNLYLLQQLNNSKEESRLAQFKKIQNGVSYSYNFGEILQSKYNEISLKEKAEYLTAMSWSLQLSNHLLEIIEPKDERYRELAKLFDIYSHISSSNDLGALISKNDVSDEEVLELLNIWLSDMKYLDEKLDYVQLANMNYTQLEGFWKTLLHNLDYDDEALNKYKQTF
ncbi:hypothetical protein AWH56_018560 [Anaerobacillus isosaccharinicus]|uniref:Uncharacterized protein n=1 Tax=Anaerobacillus isosaccharinicus TaxID=1532552 RepID=A0A1S2LGB7_9BACI|nr:hypothetical protein [Anaerobacillus isosaccharinicus]MBA5587093.1 hypothetical protein [Anaerobacillus isosaccharinicus]QOY34711.1 hypothetical protein AWH56_018560 [Anaerobacillus isosaccharinicus]